MTSSRTLRRTGAVIVLVVGVAALVAFLLHRNVPVLREPRSSAAAVLQQRILGLAAAPAASGASVPVASEAGHGPDEHEICGVGWFKIEGDKPSVLDVVRIGRQIDLPTGRRQTVDALRDDKNDRAQAMAVLLAGLGNEDHEFSFDLIGRLADIASRSRDPVLYGFVLRTCGHVRSKDSSCRLLSPAQWARLDPGNAAPWFELLASAVAARDAAARSEALHRIASSDRNVGYEGVMPRVILDHAPAGDHGALIASLLGVEAVGIEAAWVRYYPAVTSSCSSIALTDANRRQICSAVAELLVERSGDRLDQAVGVKLGESLGWPTDRTDRRRGESQAYFGALAHSFTADEDLACTTVRRNLDSFRAQADSGDVGRQRRWIAASGRTAEEFTALGRKQREAMVESRSRQERAGAAAASSSPASVAAR